MTGFLSWLLNAAVIVFAVTSMLSVGFGHTAQQVIGPLRNVRGVLRALLANFVLVPLLGLFVLRLLPLPEPHAIGIFLIATAAGAPFLIKLAEASESDVALSATLLVLLLPATIIYMPLVVPLALPDAAISGSSIAMPLLLTMLLPLAVGLLVRHVAEPIATRLQPLAARTSTIALLALLLTTILANLRGILDVILSTSALAAILVIGGAFVIGYGLGFDRASREVMGLGTAQRNIAAASVVATQAVADTDTLIVVVTASLAGFAILFPVAAWLRMRQGDAR